MSKWWMRIQRFSIGFGLGYALSGQFNSSTSWKCQSLGIGLALFFIGFAIKKFITKEW